MNSCTRLHPKGRCPAKNIKCFGCQKIGHFEAHCSNRSKKVGQIVAYNAFIREITGHRSRPTPEMEIEVNYFGRPRRKFVATPDCGAEVSIAGFKFLNEIEIPFTGLDPFSGSPFQTANGQDLRPVGSVQVSILYQGILSNETFYICEDTLGELLLSWMCLDALEILPANFSNRCPRTNKDLRKMVGNPMIIQLRDGAIPFRLGAPRKMPLMAREAILEELIRMQNIGVIKKVTHPADWVHPMVPIPKGDSQWRIGTDLTKLNKY
eukprot:TCALIF_14016-PA protein Name:"Protein of unknown function" AED:0.02 eAED:0.03 QI:0/0/0/1/0/0/3/0/264